MHHFNNDFDEFYGNLSPDQLAYSERLYFSSIDNREYIDVIIKKHVKNWDISRLAIIDKGYGSNGLWLNVFPIYYDERGSGEIGFVHSKWVRFKEYAQD